MNLPDLNKLNETWYICQNQDPVDGGYCAVIDDHGMQVPFFANDILEWKYLWLAIQFYEALWEKDYDIYDDDELKETQEKLSKIDFAAFIPDRCLPIYNSISIELEGSVSEWADEVGDPQEMADKLRNNMC